MPLPLDGIRVVDFTHVMAGPFATHFLSLLGAEVIKIEPPDGDHFRFYGQDRRYDGMSPAFVAANLGKKSIALDLKQEAGKKIVRELIGGADVVVENFRPGVIERLGFGYEVCARLRSDILFCSVSGYGQEGALRDYPALDQIVQATSGMMSINGRAEDPPLRVGYPVVDTYAGTIAAMAILAAVLKRERGGGGERIDVSMFDAAMLLMTSAVTPWLVAGQNFPRTGNQGYSLEPTASCFDTADGTIISLGVTRQPMFEAMCRTIGRPELIADPRFCDRGARNQPENAAALVEILSQVFRTRRGEEWEVLLSRAGAACGLVRDIPAGCRMEQLEDRGMIKPLQIDGLPNPDVSVLGLGFRFNVDQVDEIRPPPRIGENSEEILENLGYDAVARARLRADGVIHGENPS